MYRAPKAYRSATPTNSRDADCSVVFITLPEAVNQCRLCRTRAQQKRMKQQEKEQHKAKNTKYNSYHSSITDLTIWFFHLTFVTHVEGRLQVLARGSVAVCSPRCSYSARATCTPHFLCVVRLGVSHKCLLCALADVICSPSRPHKRNQVCQPGDMRRHTFGCAHAPQLSLASCNVLRSACRQVMITKMKKQHYERHFVLR